jgi:hypothetical protein
VYVNTFYHPLRAQKIHDKIFSLPSIIIFHFVAKLISKGHREILVAT